MIPHLTVSKFLSTFQSNIFLIKIIGNAPLSLVKIFLSLYQRERSKTKGDEVQNNPVPSICILHTFLFQQLQQIRDDKSLYFYYTKTTHVSERWQLTTTQLSANTRILSSPYTQISHPHTLNLIHKDKYTDKSYQSEPLLNKCTLYFK